jgi:hypothetical protein
MPRAPVRCRHVLDAVNGTQTVIATEQLETKKRRSGREAHEREWAALEQRLERAHPVAAELGADGLNVRAAALCSDAEGETFSQRAIEDDMQKQGTVRAVDR